jgi:release factor glutamine methyltransferase
MIHSLNSILHLIVNEKKPLQYIEETIDFLDISLFIQPPILIPRPETEYLCYQVIKMLNNYDKKYTFLDLGTGSGCIGLSLLYKYKNSICEAVDHNPIACTLAKKNALLNALNHRFFLFNESFESFFNISREKSYDLIISNPPYISKDDYLNLPDEVRLWEDRYALTDDSDGTVHIRYIINNYLSLLKKNARLVIELDKKSYEIIKNTFKNFELLYDQYNQIRAIMFINK